MNNKRLSIRPSTEDYQAHQAYEKWVDNEAIETKRSHEHHHHHHHHHHHRSETLAAESSRGGSPVRNNRDAGNNGEQQSRPKWIPVHRLQNVNEIEERDSDYDYSSSDDSGSSWSSSGHSDSGDSVAGNGKDTKYVPVSQDMRMNSDGDMDIDDDPRLSFSLIYGRASEGMKRTFKKIRNYILPERKTITFAKRNEGSGTNTPFFCPQYYDHEEEEDLFGDGTEREKHHYKLNFFQRIFVTMEHPNSCTLAFIMNWFVTLVTLLSLMIYIIGSIPEVKHTPNSCSDPACDDDPNLCPGYQICEPEPPASFPVIELICLYIFVGDYFIRVFLCLSVPARIAGTNKGHRQKLDITDHTEPESDEDDYDDEELEHSIRSASPMVEKIDMLGGSAAINYDPRRFSVATDGILGLENDFDEPSKKLLTPIASQKGQRREFREKDLPAELRDSINSSTDEYDLVKDSRGDDNTVATGVTAPTSNDSNDTPSSHGQGEYDPMPHRNLFSAIEEDRSTQNGTPKGSGRHSPRSGKSITSSYKTPAEKAAMRRKASRRKAAHGFYASLYQLYAYVKSPINVVDFIAIVPFFLLLSDSGDATQLSVVRVLRLARIVRVLKLGKRTKGLQVLSATMIASLPALFILGFFSLIGVILLGALEYFFEGGTFKVSAEYPNGEYMTPDKYGTGEVASMFNSIPISMYFSIITSTAVGFGDIVPTTYMGRAIAVAAMYGGIFVLALPISVIGNNFERIYDQSTGHLSYGVVNAILELMEDDTAENEKELHDYAYGSRLIGESCDQDDVYLTRRSLLERRASKLAAVFVIAQVCLKENEADDVNILLMKVGLLDIICALEYTYDIEFRQRQLEQFVVDSVTGFKQDEEEHLHTGETMDTSNGSGTSGDGSEMEGQGGAWSHSEPKRHQKKPSLKKGQAEKTEDGVIPARRVYEHRNSTVILAEELGEVEMAERAFQQASAQTVKVPETEISSMRRVAGLGGKKKSIVGHRLAIGEYKYGHGEDKDSIDYRAIEREEHKFYQDQYNHLRPRTQEIVRYLRRSPDFTRKGYLQELADGINEGSIDLEVFWAQHKDVFSGVGAGPGFVKSGRSASPNMADDSVMGGHQKLTRYLGCFGARHTHDKVHEEDIRRARKRVNNAYRRVEMAMHALEIDHEVQRARHARERGKYPMKTSTRVPFAGGPNPSPTKRTPTRIPFSEAHQSSEGTGSSKQSAANDEGESDSDDPLGTHGDGDY